MRAGVFLVFEAAIAGMLRKVAFPVIVSVAAVLYWSEVFAPGKKTVSSLETLSSFTFKDRFGKEILFSSFQGDKSAVLIVNVATE